VVEETAAPRCQASAAQVRSLLAHPRAVPEFRRTQSLAYPLPGLLALLAMATFCGVKPCLPARLYPGVLTSFPLSHQNQKPNPSLKWVPESSVSKTFKKSLFSLATNTVASASLPMTSTVSCYGAMVGFSILTVCWRDFRCHPRTKNHARVLKVLRMTDEHASAVADCHASAMTGYLAHRLFEKGRQLRQRPPDTPRERYTHHQPVDRQLQR
jgi:hypothetical protein